MGETTIEPLDDTAAADWLVSAIPDHFHGRVVDLVTSTFPAYARIFHRPDQGLPSGDRPSTWAAIADDRGAVFHPAAQFTDMSREADRPDTERIPGPRLGTLDPITLPLMVAHLSAHTDTPEVCWSALWAGFGSSPARWRAKPAFRLPGRQYWLFSGALADVVALSSELETAGLPETWSRTVRAMGIVQSPTIWWPHDRSWLVHSEIDYDSTIVGGTPALIQELVADPEIEALQVDGHVSLYANGDRINGSHPSGRPPLG
ncbi:hypothetical protein [Nocardioides sp. zg-1228]|uniref:hypothetical protein n=1 Tax=Nocardioides sp. zg-1228 TaxID=2763008 RepID=UPI00164356CA|nr:hypothetical protein [Nocardioides sp. zg-1228]QSF56310.1 hypothetical protein JX575_11600 [Nocardioides sp. zg-1228]